ncbi:MAG TPA: hypothetical protein DHV12_02105 [Thermotogae bacterium]|nr:hypothetical protein [Thermotogota bacterium]
MKRVRIGVINVGFYGFRGFDYSEKSYCTNSNFFELVFEQDLFEKAVRIRLNEKCVFLPLSFA